MQEFRRRSDDQGKESAQTILARIDERVNYLTDKVVNDSNRVGSYIDKNDKDIRGLYKNQYIGYGVILAIQFVIMFFKH